MLVVFCLAHTASGVVCTCSCRLSSKPGCWTPDCLLRQLDTFRPLELVNVVWAAAALGHRLDGNLLRGTLALAQVCAIMSCLGSAACRACMQ